MADHRRIIEIVRALYSGADVVPMHAPVFLGREKEYLADCIDSTFVSSVGSYVNRFEEMVAARAGASRGVSVVNGTAGLHLALVVAGVRPGDAVVTQALSFVATANAIRHAGAHPVFLDVDTDTMGLSPDAVEDYFRSDCTTGPSGLTDRTSGRRVAACVPMHTFGMPMRIRELLSVCDRFGVAVIEDAAESLGSTVEGRSTGAFGHLGVFSFNGNKTITTGGGGMIVTDDHALADRAKHLSTTAKLPHAWHYRHDEVAFNYRLTNLSAALGVAQMEQLDHILENKRRTAIAYEEALTSVKGVSLVRAVQGATSNNWLNAILVDGLAERDKLLDQTNAAGIQTRPAWTPLQRLPAFVDEVAMDLTTTDQLFDRLINLPSGYRSAHDR
jgi:aminotransferase in exopolysaccharide biosynthesis